MRALLSGTAPAVSRPHRFESRSRRFSVPTDKAMLSKILGASIFVARGLPAYAAHVQTLEDALKQTKDKDFKLTPEQIRSFEKLKHILDNAQTLDVLNTSVQETLVSAPGFTDVGNGDEMLVFKSFTGCLLMELSFDMSWHLVFLCTA